MPFTIPLTLNWLKHSFIGIGRLWGTSPDKFIEKWQKSGLQLNPLCKPDGTKLLCPICGFSMAELILKSGWSIRACSVSNFDDILKKSKLDTSN